MNTGVQGGETDIRTASKSESCFGLLCGRPEKMKRRRFRGWKRIGFTLLCVIALAAGLYGIFKPLPEGISVEGDVYAGQDVRFLYDMTYQRDGEIVREQKIFERMMEMIDSAEQFVVLDMFLFNDDENADGTYPEIARELTERLIARKQEQPELYVLFVTDPINTFYGSYDSVHIENLRAHGIDVVKTDLTQLRDSNPAYSSWWRAYLQWFGTKGKGWVANPFSADSPDTTVRSYLKLLNFKANHRKVVVTEQGALITSANPHDASGWHGNIAFEVSGAIIQDIVISEAAIIAFSDPSAGHDLVREVLTPLQEQKAIPVSGTEDGQEAEEEQSVEDDQTVEEEQTVENGQTGESEQIEENEATDNDVRVRLITEGKVKEHIVDVLEQTTAGDDVYVGMFYLSERDIIKALKEAAQRGAAVKLILDPNKDAFGREKNGVPNRPVAHELVNSTGGNIQVKWYDTQGEQFHTKMLMVFREESSTVIGGSANFTRRNVDDINLETNLRIDAPHDSAVIQDVNKYFNRIWENEDGQYTLPYEVYAEDSQWKYWLYRFQEWSGLSSF